MYDTSACEAVGRRDSHETLNYLTLDHTNNPSCPISDSEATVTRILELVQGFIEHVLSITSRDWLRHHILSAGVFP